MKKQILLSVMLMVALVGAAKDLKTLRVTTEPQMVCNNCENKIKKNIRFEKGIHEISTDLEEQVITIVYDAEKTDEEKIVKAFDKIKYKATVLKEDVGSSPATCKGEKKNNCCKNKKDKCSDEKSESCGKREGKCGETHN